MRSMWRKPRCAPYGKSSSPADFGDYSGVKITDGETKETKIKYDEHGQMIKTIYPYQPGHLLYEESKYYGDGKLWKKAVWGNAPGSPQQWIEYSYDALGRLYEVKYPDSGTLAYGYDGFSRNTLVTDNRNSADNVGGSHTFSYQYDPLNQILSFTNQDGFKVRYNYHTDGQKESIEVFEPQDLLNCVYAVEYGYDLAGRLREVNSPMLEYGYHNIAGFEYDDNGNRSLLKYYLNGSKTGNVTSFAYNYNADNMLTDFTTTGGPVFSLAGVNVDGLGRLKWANETIIRADQSYRYHTYNNNYDMRSQLTYAEITNIGVYYTGNRYFYDRAGNVQRHILETMGSSSETLYGFAGDIMQSASSSDGGDNFALTWNDNGNLTQKDDTTDTLLSFNWDNKLRSATKGIESISVKYDPMGNRVQKSTSAQGTRKYILDITGGLPTILLEIDPADGLIKKSYFYANGEVLMQQNGNHTADVNFYLHDRLSSVREVIRSNGTVAKFFTFDPFGKQREGGPFNSNFPFMFTGQYYDIEIGQYYLRARQYDPQLMRFIGRDPVLGKSQEPLTLHEYLYCANNSINRIDPSGEFYITVAEEIITTLAVYYSACELIIQSMDYQGHASNKLFNAGIDLANKMPLVLLQVMTSEKSGINAYYTALTESIEKAGAWEFVNTEVFKPYEVGILAAQAIDINLRCAIHRHRFNFFTC